MQQKLKELIDPVLTTARAAGARILEIYETDFDVEIKADNSPLTKADQAAHATIEAELAKLTPELPVLSEESAEIPYSERARWTRYWLVDPLDGTKEFVKRNGEFTVNIALIDDHRPVLGVVHVPVTGQDYFGYQDVGSFRREADGSVTEIHATQHAENPVRVVGSRSHRGASLDRYLNKLGDHALVAMGSSLKQCLVAAGEADVYPRLGPTSEWDTAAAQAVVECAGGKVTRLDGKPMLYNTKNDLLNPHFIVFGDVSRDWTKYL